MRGASTGSASGWTRSSARRPREAPLDVAVLRACGFARSPVCAAGRGRWNSRRRSCARAACAGVPRGRPRLRLALELRAALTRFVQVPPDLLAVRPRCAPPARSRARLDPRRLAPAALQPVEPRRGRLRARPEAVPMILLHILTPLENLLR